MDHIRRKPARELARSVIDGLLQGILSFGILLAAEIIAVGPGVRSSLGTPFPVVIQNYLLVGAVAGAMAGLAAALLAPAVRGRASFVSAAALLHLSATLFALRLVPRKDVGLHELMVIVCSAAAVLAAAVWISRRGVRWPFTARMPRMVGNGIVVVACAAGFAGTFAGNRGPDRGYAAVTTPNVVFVLVDALRADRLSLSGYGRKTSPFIDRLATDGTTFTNAYSHGNRTIIAMPSLFTSLYPSYARAIAPGNWSVPLPDSAVTMAELFQRSGYTTLAFMSNPYLKRPFGLTQGFDRVEEFNGGRFHLSLYRLAITSGFLRKPQYADGRSASATEVTDAAITGLAGIGREVPFFCYVHYMDVHHPYLPPLPFEKMMSSSDALEGIDPETLFRKTVGLVERRVKYPLGQEELTRLSDLYDGCIRYVDAEIERVVNSAMQHNGRPTIVVITSDHGDEFQEHGHLYHNNVVIEELIRVPLVMWRSDVRSGTRVERMVRHVDVLPTLLEWTGLEAPSSVAGRSLTALAAGRTDAASAQSVAEGDYCGAILEPDWKLMHVDSTGVDALYNLAGDSSERNDVAPLHPERRKRMRELLEMYYRAAPAASAPGATAADEETLRQLRALGYVN